MLYVQAPACCTINVSVATRTVPLRGPPVFPLVATRRLPLPDPLPPLTMLIPRTSLAPPPRPAAATDNADPRNVARRRPRASRRSGDVNGERVGIGAHVARRQR